MSSLAKLAWRTLVAARLRALIVAVVLMLQAAGLGGALVTQRSMLHTRSHWSETLGLADLEVQIGAASKDELPPLEKLRALPGVVDVTARFVALRHWDRDGHAPLPVLVQYMGDGAGDRVNRVSLVEGAPLDPAHPRDVLVDRSFFADHHLRIGDEIVLDRNRVPEAVRVAGVALSAEHLVSTANPEQLVPDRGSLGVVYASRALLDARFPEELSNDLCFRFARGADPEDTTRAVLGALSGMEIQRVTPRDASFGERYLDVMLGGASVMAPVTALIGSLVAGIVACIAVLRTASERRREIGCMLALGWRPREVATVYFALGMTPAAVGAALGAPGAVLFGRLLARTSADVAGFPEPILAWRASDLAVGSALSLVVGLVAALVPAIAVSRITPAAAMSRAGEIRFAGSPRLVEWLLRGSATARYAVRNVFRRPKLAAATLSLVALAVCVPAALLTSLSSWRTWAEVDTARFRWDAVVTFRARVGDAEARELAQGAAEHEPYVQGYATLERPGATAEQVRVRGLSTPSRLSPMVLVSGREFSRDDADEIALNAGFLQGKKVPRLGERVTLEHASGRRELVVVALFADAGLATAYVPRGTAHALFGPKYSGMYMRFPEGGDHASALAELRAREVVASIQTREELSSATSRYLSSFYAILWPFVGLSSVIALVFLAGVVSFLVGEREPEYAVLRALGHDARQVGRLVAMEVGLVACAGVVASLGAWALASYALRSAMARAWFHIPVDFRTADWLAVLVPTLVAIALSIVPAVRAMKRSTLAGALGPRAIG